MLALILAVMWPVVGTGGPKVIHIPQPHLTAVVAAGSANPFQKIFCYHPGGERPRCRPD